MKLKNNYKATKYACYLGYIIQAITVNFAPLLFVTFNRDFGISINKIALISSLNFTTQLTVDALTAGCADKLGYRRLAVTAQFFSMVGIIGYGIFPYVFNDAFAGILLSSVLAAIGGGLIEVLISPIIEALPTDNKSASMSILHSFYCWGQAGVVLLSTIYFRFFGIENWWYLAMLWGIIPLMNCIMFLRVPISKPIKDGEGLSARELLSNKIFPVLLLLMFCSGASELAMAQWASAFAEAGLNVSKSLGDLFGPCLFAILMGSARVIYSIISRKYKLFSFMAASTVLCIISYFTAALSKSSAVSLLGCALCGFSVGIMWPGTISIASSVCKKGGTLMFGLLALFGDIGCTAGTAFVGYASGFFGGNLKKGIFSAVVFPVLMLIGLIIFFYRKKENKES